MKLSFYFLRVPEPMLLLLLPFSIFADFIFWELFLVFLVGFVL